MIMSLVSPLHEKSDTPNSGKKKIEKRKGKSLAAYFHGRSDTPNLGGKKKNELAVNITNCRMQMPASR